MRRSDVNQELLSLFNAPSYLEIGVYDGVTFDAILAPRKVAVDVSFHFDWRLAAKDPTRQGVSYYEYSSDAYFSDHNKGETFDLVFIDGLHTFEQTLRDLLNSLSVLRRGGVVVIDDVLPDSYAASLPEFGLANEFRRYIGDHAGSWMGDVFRLVFFIDSYLPAYSFAMVQENHGQLVLWAESRAMAAPRALEDICRMPYYKAVMEKPVFRAAPFVQIREQVARWRAGLSD